MKPYATVNPFDYGLMIKDLELIFLVKPGREYIREEAGI